MLAIYATGKQIYATMIVMCVLKQRMQSLVIKDFQKSKKMKVDN